VAVDADYMFVADDETQVLRLFSRRFDGPPLWQRDFTSSLGLTDLDELGHPREVDIEASLRVGSRIYWLGSHSNCGGCTPVGESRPNRNRLFATDIVGTGATAQLRYVGRYHNLKRDLLAWDNANGHGLGPRALQLAASAAAGVPPENVQRTGFNIEAFGLAPDGSAAYLGFRSPLTPASGRTNALLIPILNLPDLVRDSPSMGPARFGRPLELALDGRGFRSLDSSPNGMVIVAGTTTNTGSFLIYTWSGVAGEPPQERLVSFSVAKPEGLLADGAFATGTQIQLISEGDVDTRSEYVMLGPPIPMITSVNWTDATGVRLSILGRSATAYDIEAADDGGTWRFVQQIRMSGGPLLWTNSTLPAAQYRLFRVRYPAR